MIRMPGPARRFGLTALLLTAIIGPTLLGRAPADRAGAQPAPSAAVAQPERPLSPQPAEPEPASTAEAPPGPPAAVDQAATPTRTPTPINIGNFVWDDLDKDGRQDAGEPGLAGVTVQLWNSTKTQLIDLTVTNANGNYTVVAPVPGDYRLRVLLPSAADQFSPKDQAGGDNQLDSDINPSGTNFGFTDIFTLASNIISTTLYDAGIIVYRPPTPTRTPTPINIGNFVWFDLDADGIQDAGEPGIGGVTVQLWNAERTLLIDDATTTASGNYTVIAPLPGDYRIRVLLPAGASFAPKDAGADDQRDSDINRNLLLNTYGFSDVFTLASNLISTTLHDAGLLNVPPTATPSLTPTGPTPTRTPTATLPAGTPTTGTPPAGYEERTYLPLVQR